MDISLDNQKVYVYYYNNKYKYNAKITVIIKIFRNVSIINRLKMINFDFKNNNPITIIKILLEKLHF